MRHEDSKNGPATPCLKRSQDMVIPRPHPYTGPGNASHFDEIEIPPKNSGDFGNFIKQLQATIILSSEKFAIIPLIMDYKESFISPAGLYVRLRQLA